MCMFKKINCADSNSYGKFRIRYNRGIIESVETSMLRRIYWQRDYDK